jgi:uncharacterized protein
MARPVHFEMQADDPERAAAFYGDVFGWSVEKWDGPIPYWLITTGGDGPGIDGGLSRRGSDPSPNVVITMGVESADATAAAVESAGGTVIRAKMAVPGVGWLIYCRDTEGNEFGAMQPDESAA